MEKNLLELKKHILPNQASRRSANETVYIPVTFHLVANNNGTGRISEKLVLEQLCSMNTDFAEIGFQFYLKDSEFNYVNNSAVYSDPRSASNGIMNLLRDNSSLNIWIVDNPDNGTNSAGVTLAYMDYPRDWIVANKDFVNGSDMIMSHELGHFFGLLHTFNGWDSDPYDPSIHGTPAPVNSPRGTQTEKMDGSNGNSAGDFLSDTKPDYNFGLGDNDCDYNGGALDPDGTLVDPDELLYMGYFLTCDRENYKFSPEQNDIMLASYNSSNRRYLRNQIAPTTQIINTLPQLTFPANGSTVSNDAPINLQWTAPPGATHYMLEVSLLPTFSVQNQRFFVTGNSFQLDGNLVEDGRRYFWRVKPYNAYSTCQTFTTTQNFTIGNTTAIPTIESFESFSILSNPTQSGEDIDLLIKATENSQVNFSIYNLNGQLLYQKANQRILNGINSVSIPTSSLSAGIYLMRARNEEGQVVKKVVIY
ncbi:MAG: zinc-dependent metalloprotease [Bacteroidota bacterium]